MNEYFIKIGFSFFIINLTSTKMTEMSYPRQKLMIVLWSDYTNRIRIESLAERVEWRDGSPLT